MERCINFDVECYLTPTEKLKAKIRGYEERLDWSEFTKDFSSMFTSEFVKMYKHKIDFSVIDVASNTNEVFFDEYAGRLDWSRYKRVSDLEFYIRFKDYIDIENINSYNMAKRDVLEFFWDKFDIKKNADIYFATTYSWSYSDRNLEFDDEQAKQLIDYITETQEPNVRDTHIISLIRYVKSNEYKRELLKIISTKILLSTDISVFVKYIRDFVSNETIYEFIKNHYKKGYYHSSEKAKLLDMLEMLPFTYKVKHFFSKIFK